MMKICKTCPNEVETPWSQCPDCIAQNVSIEDHEAGEIILDRVLAGLCQCCGKKEGCTCVYVDPTRSMTTTKETSKTGRLAEIHSGRWNKSHVACVDCDSKFYRNSTGLIKCNGHTITLCPWCRPDSQPWKNGRGL